MLGKEALATLTGRWDEEIMIKDKRTGVRVKTRLRPNRCPAANSPNYKSPSSFRALTIKVLTMKVILIKVLEVP